MQTDFKVERDSSRTTEISAPLNVEDAIGCRSCYRGEYTLTSSYVSCEEVVPVWGDQIVHVGARQANGTEILIVSTRKLQIAV